MRLNKITIEKETLAEAMQSFLQFKIAQQHSKSTMKDYNLYLNEFLTFSSNSLEQETLNAEILTYFSNIPNTSPARYNHRYQYLSAFFNWAVDNHKLEKNPIVSQKLHKKKDDGNIKPATIEEVKALLKSWDKTTFCGLRNYIITLLILDTGIRTSELRRLTDAAVDIPNKQIIIDKTICKTSKTRIIYLSDTTAKQLSKYMKVKPDGFSELVFPTREGNELTSEGLAREFARQCKKIGIKFTPYQLRHSFASYFVASGGNVFTLQDLMGHSDIRMTKRYTEIDENQKKQAHNSYSPVNALQGASRLVKIG